METMFDTLQRAHDMFAICVRNVLFIVANELADELHVLLLLEHSK